MSRVLDDEMGACTPNSYLDGPTACRPTKAVLSSIRKEIKSARALSAADIRLAARMGLVAADLPRRTGFNDGVFYPPEEFNEQLRAPSGAPLRGALLERAGRTSVRKLHALALMVDFSDNVGTRPKADFQKMLFDPTNPNSMASIYLDMSYGKLVVTGDAVGYLRMPKLYSYYTNNQSGTGNQYPKNTPGLLHDALTKFCATDSLARFDVDGDGYVDAIFLIHAGGGAEAERDPVKRKAMIWSHKWTLPTPFTHKGIKVYAYSTEPEDGKVGVFSHEFGHVLGLPDLYDTSYRSEGIGDWCLMSGGSWGGGGSKPARMSCWCLSKLGWINPTLAKTASYALQTLETDASACLKIPVAASAKEYFMVENRQKTGRDSSLPGSGLAIWHIDESQSDNTNPISPLVGLMQADGLRDLEKSANSGDAGDVFPGSSGNKKFDDTTNPSATLNSGVKSKIAVSAISQVGTTVKLKVKA